VLVVEDLAQTGKGGGRFSGPAKPEHIGMMGTPNGKYLFQGLKLPVLLFLFR